MRSPAAIQSQAMLTSSKMASTVMATSVSYIRPEEGGDDNLRHPIPQIGVPFPELVLEGLGADNPVHLLAEADDRRVDNIRRLGRLPDVGMMINRQARPSQQAFPCPARW